MTAYDVSVRFTLNAVVRGARDAAHALEIAQALSEVVEAANESLSGADYGQPLVTEYSLNYLGTPMEIQAFEDDTPWINPVPDDTPALDTTLHDIEMDVD